MLRLEMLPAERGDCLLLEYGAGADVEHRVLIDGGKAPAWSDIRARLLAIPPDMQGRRHFELLVITHIDTDHIDGVIALLQDRELNCWFNDIWFNGWRHLEPLDPDVAVSAAETLGPKQGEFLGALLTRLGQPWNRHFGGRTVVVPDEGPLPQVELAGGLKLTLLSPDRKQLLRLRREWKRVIEDVGFSPGDDGAALIAFGNRMLTPDSIVTLGDGRAAPDPTSSTRDGSVANASSIAFSAQFGDHRLLLVGDAVKPVLVPSLKRLRSEDPSLNEEDRIPFDAFKLSHHGSDKNVSPELLEMLDCRTYLVSTNGKGFHHPNASAIVTVANSQPDGAKPHLCFNYRSADNEMYEGNERWTTAYGDDAILEFPDGA